MASPPPLIEDRGERFKIRSPGDLDANFQLRWLHMHLNQSTKVRQLLQGQKAEQAL